MATLDLHGVRHADVEDKVLDFAHVHTPPFEIVTGNSLRMKEIVGQTLATIGLEAVHLNANNLGSVTVIEPL